MSLVLPNSDIEQGQLYGTWEVYNKYMQHILRLRDIFEEERKASSEFTAPKLFCEILNDYQRYASNLHVGSYMAIEHVLDDLNADVGF
jgi:hypothetical protein